MGGTKNYKRLYLIHPTLRGYEKRDDHITQGFAHPLAYIGPTALTVDDVIPNITREFSKRYSLRS